MAKNNNNKGHRNTAKRPSIITVVTRAPRIHRKDIGDWLAAKQAAVRVERPRFDRLQELYQYILDDAHLTAQVQLRKSKVLGSEFVLVREGGETDDKATELFARRPSTRRLIEMVLDAQLFGYSLVELAPHGGPDPIDTILIDRRNIVPGEGLALYDTTASEGIAYRQLREYGTSLLEFRTEGLGVLDKAIPHVLFKRFAQSCWSEFCEVCGMPPRVIKTNTQDPELRNAYIKMLSDMGTGANGLLDIDDEMQFIATNASNGESYENLIRLCSNELSLLINGAVLGQDTKNGSNSKEQTSNSINDEIVNADLYTVETAMNATVLPAMERLGLLPGGLLFRYREQEDAVQLFDQTMRAAQYFEIDPEWVRTKFGIEVTGPRQTAMLAAPTDGDTKGRSLAYNPAFDPFV